MISDKTEIERMLPHAGAMVLLDEVQECDKQKIVCAANSHLDQANPLMIDGALSVFAGIEYAAQAMALHNFMLAARAGGAPGEARQGVVAVASKLQSFCQRLDLLKDTLVIEVAMIDQTGDSSMYEFKLLSAQADVLSGRLLVMLT